MLAEWFLELHAENLFLIIFIEHNVAEVGVQFVIAIVHYFFIHQCSLLPACHIARRIV
ncbi:hypothetical protein D3C86_2140590 [compost metagenome]